MRTSCSRTSARWRGSSIWLDGPPRANGKAPVLYESSACWYDAFSTVKS